MQLRRPTPHAQPADLVRCSAPEHQKNPLHDAWMLGNDGETYCATELGRLRQMPAPTAPVNVLLMRAQREYRGDSVEWHRHFEDMIARDFYRAAVQAPNGETYSLEDIAKVLTVTPRFRDPRAPYPMHLPARLVPNFAVQHLAAQLGEFDPNDNPYRLPRCSAGQLSRARFHFDFLKLYEERHPVACELRDSSRSLSHWEFLLFQASVATAEAMEYGAPELQGQAAQIAARVKLSPSYVNAEYRAHRWAEFLCHCTVLGLSTPLLTHVLLKWVGPLGIIGAIGIATALTASYACGMTWPLYAATLPLEGGPGQWVRESLLRCTTPWEARRRMNTVSIALASAQIGAFANDLAGEPISHLHACAMGAIVGGIICHFFMGLDAPRPPVQPCYVAPLSEA